MRFLSAEQVIEMHSDLLSRYGGSEGGGHRGAIDYAGVQAAVAAVKNSYYEKLTELAAAYAVYIVQGHVFQDGNKRTGAAAMLTFLAGNRVQVDIAINDLANTMVELQTRSEAGDRTDALIPWLASLIDRPAGEK